MNEPSGASPVVKQEPARCTARFVARQNRFVVWASLDGHDEEVRAYLPNTARLTDLLVPGAPLILRHNDDPGRRTRWTVTRVWDATWVALEASAASRLVADHLDAGGALPGWPAIRAVRREVARDGHRFDLEVVREDERVGVVEVKSLSRSVGGIAPLSSTPSTRGVAHLAALGRLAAEGIPTAVVFAIQREDVRALDLTAKAEASWSNAVRQAIERGVHVVAYACAVDQVHIALGQAVPVRGGDAAAG